MSGFRPRSGGTVNGVLDLARTSPGLWILVSEVECGIVVDFSPRTSWQDARRKR
jgi:hypothetical protein